LSVKEHQEKKEDQKNWNIWKVISIILLLIICALLFLDFKSNDSNTKPSINGSIVLKNKTGVHKIAEVNITAGKVVPVEGGEEK